LGAHPEGCFSNIAGVNSYGEDYDFMLEQRRMSKDAASLDTWLKQWVYDVKDHGEYSRRLGSKRVSGLKSKLKQRYWQDGLPSGRVKASGKDANRTEVMIIAASRKIAERVKEGGYSVLLAGIGTPGLAAWLAFFQLKNAGVDVELALGSGVLGYLPGPGDPNLLSVCHVPSASMLMDTSEMYGFIITGEGARCLSVIGAAQIDECEISILRGWARFTTSAGCGNNDTPAAPQK
jgi:hypothetical protein